MIKVKAIGEFSFKKFDKLKNIKRANENKNKEGYLFVGDVFECDTETVKYLTGDNSYKKAFVEIIEVIPEIIKEVEPPKEVFEIKKPRKTKIKLTERK